MDERNGRRQRTPRHLEAYHIPPPDESLPDGMTRRSALCLYLYVEEGWSYAEIGQVLGLTHPTIISDVRLAKDVLAREVGLTGYPFIETFIGLWRRGEQRTPRNSALRHEQLAQDLELLIEQRCHELDEVSECMGAGCSLSHSYSHGQDYTHWERRYLHETGRTSVAAGAYCAKRRGYSPAHWCVNDWHACSLDCAGCDHNR